MLMKRSLAPFDRVENIVGKGENAGYQHLLLFQQCFPKVIKIQDCKELNSSGKG